MPDRRIIKTQRSVFMALLKLMSEKPFDSISVKELCEQAEINKSTFYLHFKDIYDCKEKWMQYNVASVLEINIKNDLDFKSIMSNPKTYLIHVFDYFEENMSYYKRLYNSPYYGDCINEFKKLTIAAVAKVNHISILENYPEYLSIVFLVGGVVDTIFSSINTYDRNRLAQTLEAHIRYGFFPV